MQKSLFPINLSSSQPSPSPRPSFRFASLFLFPGIDFLSFFIFLITMFFENTLDQHGKNHVYTILCLLFQLHAICQLSRHFSSNQISSVRGSEARKRKKEKKKKKKIGEKSKEKRKEKKNESSPSCFFFFFFFFFCPSPRVLDRSCLTTLDRLVGLVVKASASRAEDSGSESRLRRDFSGSSHTSDFKKWHSSGHPAWRLAL